MALKASRTEIFDELWLIVASVIKYLIIVNMYLGNTVCIHITSCLLSNKSFKLKNYIHSLIQYNIIVTAQNGFLYKEIYNKDFKVMAPLLTFTQRDFVSSSQKPVIVLFFSYCVL